MCACTTCAAIGASGCDSDHAFPARNAHRALASIKGERCVVPRFVDDVTTVSPTTAPMPSLTSGADRLPSAPGDNTTLPAPLAMLEATRGKLAGQRWRVDRAVSTLGRGVENDVRVADDSVSMSHATLLLKGDEWFLVDLRSSNGTYVDGHRISGERALVLGSTLRFGAVELTFTPTVNRKPSASSTRHVAGFAERFSKLW